MADKEFGRDQERLAKLWDAYETQERELDLAMKKISDLENKIKEYERINSTLKNVVEGRDKDIRELEIKLVALEEDSTRYKPQIEDLKRAYNEEKERYAKLFIITEELEEELAATKKELEIRDMWFKNNIGVLTNLNKSIKDRDMMVKEIKTTRMTIPPPTPAKTNMEPLTPITPSEANSTMKPPEVTEEEKIIFEKMTSAKSEQAPNSAQESSKPDVINQFTEIEDITAEHAEALYGAGFTSMDNLKGATTEELAKVEGISPTLARKIRTSLL
jgi:predicted flap endonuclease-1-like 5' DNA nuclease/molybdopterin converting factor small subunit